MLDEKFEKDKICYEQNYAQFRNLNNIMWQVPIIAMTLTGGAWYAVANLKENISIQIILLLLASAGNFGLIAIIYRIRFVIEKYLVALKNFHPEGFVTANGNTFCTSSKTVAKTFSVLMSLAAISSLVAIGMLTFEHTNKDNNHDKKIIILQDR
ncbi:hypothetical protein [Emcibacter sp.]|uniref:hypothetical protein n=1 Tax=Emcibacter sp. TaxID=1979954 RepID=UPI002AA68D15|nr:hypothetical protein [Emcibacter sp.]